MVAESGTGNPIPIPSPSIPKRQGYKTCENVSLSDLASEGRRILGLYYRYGIDRPSIGIGKADGHPPTECLCLIKLPKVGT
jgi:hypothetical protein